MTIEIVDKMKNEYEKLIEKTAADMKSIENDLIEMEKIYSNDLKSYTYYSNKKINRLRELEEAAKDYIKIHNNYQNKYNKLLGKS